MGVDLSLQGIGFPGPKGFQLITVDDERRSVSYKLPPGQAALTLGEQVPGVDGKTAFKQLAQVALPGSSGRWLVLFLNGQGGSPGWSNLILSDEPTSVPPGGYRFVNLLNDRAGILLGSEKHIIPPGESLVVEVAPPGNQIIFKAQVYRIPDGEPTVVFSNIWSVDKEQRHLVLILPSDESTTGVAVKRLSEYVNLIPAASDR